MKKFRTPKSIKVFKVPTKKNLAACRTIKTFFPIKEAKNIPNRPKKGKIIINNQRYGETIPTCLRRKKEKIPFKNPIIAAKTASNLLI